MWQDLRYSFRTLAGRPAFSLTAAAVLALGLGLNIALFSTVYAVLLKPLVVSAPERLTYIYHLLPRQPDRPWVTDGRFYEFLRDHNEVFEDLTGHWGISMMLTVAEETETTRGEWVLANYFGALGVQPAFGRAFRPEDDSVATTDLSVVISHRLWTRRFGSNPAVIGTKVRLGLWQRTPDTFTIVGVMGPEFRGVSDPWTPSDFWVTFAGGNHKEARQGSFGLIGRLKPDVSQRQARAVVAVQGEHWQESRKVPQEYRARFVAYPASAIRMPFDPTAAVVPLRLSVALTVVVAAVLVISVTNIAGLLVARGIARTGEVAVRRVLGAGTWRIARQLLIESLLLAGLGGALGFVGAAWLLDVFRAATPNRFDLDPTMDSSVALYAVALCLSVGIAVGVVPAIRAARVDLVRGLPGTGIGTLRHIQSNLRRWVVIPQLSLALALLLLAALHVRSLAALERADLGYSTDNAVVANFTRRMAPADPKADQKALAEKNAAESRLFYRQLLGRLEDVPGADSVALTSMLPLSVSGRPGYAAIAKEDALPGDSAGVATSVEWVSPQYFRTMQMSLSAGREFDERDALNMPKVAIVSAAIARRLWPGRDPIGRFVAARNLFPTLNEQIEWLEVVGVVNEIDPILRDVGQSPFVYRPLSQAWLMGAGTLVAHVSGDPQAVVDRLRDAVSGAGSSAEVFKVQTLRQMVAEILYPRRLAAGVLAASGLTGLFLATVGLYGLIAHSLAQRLHELGVRVALGAERRHIIGMVLRDGAALGLSGFAVGAVLTWSAIRVSARMFGTAPPMDAVTVIGIPLLLGAVILVACYVPARRAARADPMAVLRRT